MGKKLQRAARLSKACGRRDDRTGDEDRMLWHGREGTTYANVRGAEGHGGRLVSPTISSVLHKDPSGYREEATGVTRRHHSVPNQGTWQGSVTVEWQSLPFRV